MPEYKAFVFDFDGVLADSVEVKTRAFADLFAEFGPEVEQKVVDHHRDNGGMPRAEKFKHYYAEFLKQPLDQTGLEKVCQRFSTLVKDQVVAASAIAGAEEFLDKWSGRLSCFVDSATPDEEIVEIVSRRGLSGHFKEVLGSGRPKAENLAWILDKYGLEPETVLFFGDAASDYKAAMTCGTDFMGIVPDENAPLLKFANNIRWHRDFISVSDKDLEK